MTAPQELKYPWMRRELLDHLRALANVQNDPESWRVDGNFDLAVHFLFDDSPRPESAVGFYLHDREEVGALGTVTRAIDALLAKYGSTLKDLDYVRAPEWSSVVQAAQTALQVLASKAKGDGYRTAE